ncbi:MAG: hypothetical protein WBV25_06370 [Methylocella sp.]
MNILKRVLTGTLRLAFFGALKAALHAYMLFLPDSTLAGTASESNGYVGDGVSRAASKGNSIATASKADAGARESCPNSLQLFRSWESLD